MAAGNGNCSLAAARRFGKVTSTDYVQALLEDGRRRAEAERLSIKFQEADAEALPFADGSFDVVLSSFGVMFAPNHVQRGQRTGPRLPLEGAHRPGQLDAARIHRPAVRGRRPARAAAAGVDAAVALGAGGLPRGTVRASASEIRTTHRDFVFRYRSAEHWVDVFRSWYGPVHKAFAALEAEGQPRLERDLIDLIRQFNTSGDSTVVIPAEYAEVVVLKA